MYCYRSIYSFLFIYLITSYLLNYTLCLLANILNDPHTHVTSCTKIPVWSISQLIMDALLQNLKNYHVFLRAVRHTHHILWHWCYYTYSIQCRSRCTLYMQKDSFEAFVYSAYLGRHTLLSANALHKSSLVFVWEKRDMDGLLVVQDFYSPRPLLCVASFLNWCRHKRKLGLNKYITNGSTCTCTCTYM